MSYTFTFTLDKSNKIEIKHFNLPLDINQLLEFSDYKIIDIQKITCIGCINYLENQQAHMDKDGCLST
jgi:hypothetical protein